jgi:hypothetical protein
VNIFAVDEDPQAAARSLSDRHVVKMTLETAQILCTVAHEHALIAPYRATHARHPCVVWAGECRGNWAWLVRHGLALAAEYTRRYHREHKSLAVILWACRAPVAERLPRGRRRPFVQAMPERFRGPDAVAAYRRYYRSDKAGFATWRKPARPPRWWRERRGRQ